MINKREILKNIGNKDDKILFSKILDQLALCEKNYEPTFTDFLPLVKYEDFFSLLKNKYIEQNILFFGGFSDSERVVIGFFPEYMEASFEKFPISILEISYNEKYTRGLLHRDFLGSILGLGIDRGKVGDIILDGNRAICFIYSDIQDYVNINLEKVGSSKVKTKIVSRSDFDIPSAKFEEKNIIVSSLRLDAVLSGAFNIARGKISDYIRAEKTFVNFVLETSTSKNIKSGDIVTLRGVGRIKIDEIVGKTKKDRIIVNILKYI